MSEWREYKLEDFVDIHNQTRIPLSKMERSKKQGIYPYYGASGIIDYVDDFLFDGEFVLISEDGENLKSRQTPIAFKANGKFWVNNHAHIVQGKKDFHNELIVYYFKNLDAGPHGALPSRNKINCALAINPKAGYDILPPPILSYEKGKLGSSLTKVQAFTMSQPLRWAFGYYAVC